MIIGKDSEELSEIENNLRQVNFKKITLQLYNELYDGEQFSLKNQNESQFHLVLFINLNSDQINSYIKKSLKNFFVAYTKEILEIDQREKINFANSPFTLYWRIMEVLIYQYAKKR